MAGSYFLLGSNLEKYGFFFGKKAVFPGGYGRIGEIPHGRIWLDWGLEGELFDADIGCRSPKNYSPGHSVQN